ncbi:hypothetical protein, partial [Erythrobacter sp. YJ-T3-07]|uniref:hypothetical protein n=1 Tax=Erythrobacter sp. YJ-T3-07 TaxID=2793063 RepID=UPI001F400AC2
MDMPSFVLGRVNPSRQIWKRITGAETTPNAQLLTEMEVVTGMPRSMLDVFDRLGEDDSIMTEKLFWEWKTPDDTSPQLHYWHSWRYAGILETRRRRKCSREKTTVSSDGEDVNDSVQHIPSSREILEHLMGELEAMYQNL